MLNICKANLFGSGYIGYQISQLGFGMNYQSNWDNLDSKIIKVTDKVATESEKSLTANTVILTDT